MYRQLRLISFFLYVNNNCLIEAITKLGTIISFNEMKINVYSNLIRNFKKKTKKHVFLFEQVHILFTFINVLLIMMRDL